MNALRCTPLVLLFSLASAPAAWAQGGAVYRCPGPPVLYTDALTPAEAREKGCRLIEGQPITVIQGPRSRAPGAANSAAPASRNGDSKIDPQAQRQRDSDARRILEAELGREEGKLAALRAEFNSGEPERRGDERNYERYLERVAALRAGIARSESDIAALKRELSKLPP